MNVVAFPLQLLATDFAVQVLYQLGIPALREGNIIHLANTQLFVADACSGLRSLTALITLGVTFAYFFRKSFLERALLVVSTIPIAIGVNALRVALTGILTHYWGPEAAKGWFHQLEGLMTFGLAFLVLLIEASLLRLVWPRRWKRAREGGAPVTSKLLAALLFLGVNAYTYHYFATEEVIPRAPLPGGLPAPARRVALRRSEKMQADVLDMLGATDYLICGYERAGTGEVVGVYIGYHQTQVRKEGGGLSRSAIHTPNHCLPGSGWDVIGRAKVSLEFPGLPGGAARR